MIPAFSKGFVWLLPKYGVNAVDDPIYDIGATPDGITTMTVKSGVSGFKYFSVTIVPVRENSGQETVVFTHLTGGVQKAINTTVADFDLVSGAQAGFNVSPGDMVKVFIVDALTNAIDFNPTVLQ